MLALEKKLPDDATIEDWIHDFVHSSDKRFEGKSKKERIRMALGAYYGRNVSKAAKDTKEEAEYQDEPNDGERCKDCTMFSAPNACSAVAGAISPNGWCSYFESDEDIQKAKPRTLYVCRYVQNAKDIISWAKKQGFKQTLKPEDLHVTIAHSKTPVNWMEMGGNSWGGQEGGKDNLTIVEGGPRLVEPLGDKGAVVLLFNSEQLTWRNEAMRDRGAQWDFDGYQPHITITWDAEGLDLEEVEPYTGPIVLGPEIFSEVDDNWSDNITEKALQKIHKRGEFIVNLNKRGARHSASDMEMLQTMHDHAVKLGASCSPVEKHFDAEGHANICKVDEGLGLVFGYAIVCKRDGADYYDLNVDRDTGHRVPEHITEKAMLEAAVDFADTRVAKEMHWETQEGTIPFIFPLTTDIAKAMGISTNTTGLMIAMKPKNKEMLKKFQDGTYTGFSIGGSRVKIEESEG